MVRLVHGRDEFQSQISEGKSSTYPISLLTSKSKPLLSLQHGPLGFPSYSLREIALVRSADHLHCQIQWSASIFILHHFLSAQSNWESSLTPFSKMTAVQCKFSSCLPERFFFMSFVAPPPLLSL